MNNIHERIKSDEFDKTVNAEKQNRHIRDSDGYVEGRSYLLDGVDAQKLVDRYHGTGFTPINKRGEWKNTETIEIENIIGISINPVTGVKTRTNIFTIHYSKTGTHIVPTKMGRLSQ